jgi:hypothetical protein
MNDQQALGTVADLPADEFDFDVTDVTRSRPMRARNVPRSIPAGIIARSLAARLRLPDNVPWTLRDDSTSVFLDEGRAIGEQIQQDSKVTLTPMTHLGSVRLEA